MEVTKKQKMLKTEVPVYIACDGTEFDNATECETYEEELKEKALEGIETCEDAEGLPPSDGEGYVENHEYFWYRPKNTGEVNLLNEVYKLKKEKFGEEDIGKWVCVEKGYYGDAWGSSAEKSIKYVKNLLETLGYDVEFNLTEKKGS